MKTLLFNLFFFVFFLLSSTAQTVYFEENFEIDTANNETISDILGSWEQEYVSDLEWNWKVADGTGYDNHPPFSAYEGEYDAFFFRDDGNVNITKLITPEFSLEYAIKPELSFYLSQYLFHDEFGTGNSTLTLYYRSPEIGNNWVKLKKFSEPIDGWEQQVVLLPDSVRYSVVQLAFEGLVSDNVHGTSIDNIKVIETGVIPKYLSSVTLVQASQDIIPTNSINNPILKLRFLVKGNDGVLLLDSLVIDALYDAGYVVPQGGVKLFYTEEAYFNDTIPVGNSEELVNGQAIFTDLNLDLPFGESYVWVTFDVPPDPNNTFKNMRVDAKIPVKGIKVNDGYYPDIEMNPSGYREINKSLFYDNFEGELFWNLSGEFQISHPLGLNGNKGSADPTYAFSGVNVLGDDLTGLGTYKGGYEIELESNADVAETDTLIDAIYYKNLQVGFYQWLNAHIDDYVTIDISTDGGNTWQSIWENTRITAEDKYSFKTLGVGSIADRKGNIKFRFTTGPTGYFSRSGWNIDNFAVTGSFIEHDAGFLSLLAPSCGCGHTATEPVKVVIGNYGYLPTNDTIPVGYSLDGGVSWVMDTLFETIPRGGVDTLIFQQYVDLTNPGEYNFLVKSFLDGDEDERNDVLDTVLFSAPTYKLPYAEDFEENSGFWRAFGESETWQYGVPTDSIIDNAFSGNRCWVTNLSGHYSNSDSTWLESPCFDFSNAESPILEFVLWADAQVGKDGLSVYYTIDEGANWNIVPTETNYNFDWDWYNNSNIEALKTEGWDSVNQGWFLTRQLLPSNVAGENDVKFRFLFVSDDTITDAGFAVDNIRIYEAPIDAGFTSIVSPQTSCYLSDQQQVQVQLKNFGVRKIKTSDILYASLEVDGMTIETDTFSLTSDLNIGSTVFYTFDGVYNMYDKRTYNIVAYTHIDGDTAFYEKNVYNDSVESNVSVLGEPYYSLGPDVGTLQPDTVVLDAGISLSNPSNYTYQWNISDSTNQTFHVGSFGTGVSEETFSVTVTNKGNSCQAKDTIRVINSISDRGVIAISGVGDGCVNTLDFNLTIDTIKNYSDKDTLNIGDQIGLGYQIEDDPEHIEYLTVSKTVLPDSFYICNYKFLQQPQLNESGDYVLKVFTSTNADLNYKNDTTYRILHAYPLPEVNIGEDTLYSLRADTIVFDAGDGFAYYKWLDGVAGGEQTYNVISTISNKYYVEVKDTNNCGLDSDTVMVVADNWVLDSIISPLSSCVLDSNEEISVSITNKSPNSFSSGFLIPSVLIVDGNRLSEDIVLNNELSSGESFVYTFSQSYDFSSIGSHNVRVEILPQIDISTKDNYINREVDVWGIYPVELGEDTIITKRADTIVLDAGDRYASYSWQDKSSEQFYHIPSKRSLQYYVEVTSEHGCSNSSDTVRIIAYDIGVSEILSPSSSCDLTTSKTIRLNIHNYGEDQILAGTVIPFYYRIDDGEWIEKQYTLSTNFDPESNYSVILYEEIDFEQDKSYMMYVYSRLENDYFYDNDTAVSVIYQFESPTVDLGEDIVTSRPDTVVIDAGSGYATYKWQDGSIDRYFDVTQPNTQPYSVTVTNSNGCYARDTVNVYTYDIGVDGPEQSMNSCEVAEIDVAMKVKVNSEDTVKAGTTINATYIYNGVKVDESFVVLNDFGGDDTYSYTFNQKINLQDTGTYDITFSVSMDNEVTESNNTLDTSFRIGVYPLNFPDVIKTYEDEYVIRTAPYYTDYLWSTGSTDDTLVITLPGEYSLEVTDINTCTDKDTTNVIFIEGAYSIEGTNLTDECSSISPKQLTIDLKNIGNDTLNIGENIDISYSTDEWITRVDETYTIEERFTPGEVRTIPFNTGLDISNYGDYTIYYEVNVYNKKSSYEKAYELWELPDVDLGADIKSVEESVTIDAGSGYNSYLWSTGSTLQSINVSEAGDYWVTVTNSRCPNSDTVNVYFYPEELSITELITPDRICGVNVGQIAKVKVVNTGKRTVKQGSTINLGIETDGNPRINESVEISGNLLPGYAYFHEFTKPFTVNQAGMQTVYFYVGTQDIDTDTAEYSLMAYEMVFFGGKDIIHAEALPITLDPGVSADTYVWSTGETTPIITAESYGQYWVSATQNSNQCTFTDTVEVKYGTGVSEEWVSGITIYPNPASENVTINLPEGKKDVIIKIMDVKGSSVFMQKDVSEDIYINVSQWRQGVYIIQIFNDEEFGVYQFVKE